MLRSTLLAGALAALSTLTACPPPAGTACTSSNDCRSDEICYRQLCRSACNSNVDCRGTEICQGGVCLARSDAGGADGTAADGAVADRATRDLLQHDAATPDARLDGAVADSAPADQRAADAATGDIQTSDGATADAASTDAAVADRAPPDSAPADACPPPDPFWWNPGYRYRAPLVIDAAPGEYTLEFDLIGAAASDLFQRSLGVDGNDLRIVWTQSGAIEIDREVLAFSQERVSVRFRLQLITPYPGGSGDYYLYLGAANPDAPKSDRINVYEFFDDFEGHPLDSNGSPQFNAGPSGTWQVVASGSHGHVFRAGGDTSCYGPLVGIALANAVVETQVALLAARGTNPFVGLIIRGSDLPSYGGTYYNITLSPESDRFRIGHIVDGNPQSGIDSTSTTVHYDQWYQLSARYAGLDVSATLDHGLTIGGTGLEIGDSQIALVSYQADAVFDDVKVRQLVEPEPTVALGAWQTPCQ